MSAANLRWLQAALALLITVSRVWGSEKRLKCYQCNVESNDLCTEEYLKPCPSDQAYDRCMTTVSYDPVSGFGIQKTCALGPCALRDPSHETSLALDENCDRTKSSYSCVGCCKVDGCNKSSGDYPRRSAAFLLAATALQLWRYFMP